MESELLTPEQVCDLIPGLTRGKLANMRYTGEGPSYFKPTPKTVVYRRVEIFRWLESTAQSSTLCEVF
jgi:hypothetical protein